VRARGGGGGAGGTRLAGGRGCGLVGGAGGSGASIGGARPSCQGERERARGRACARACGGGVRVRWGNALPAAVRDGYIPCIK
jgi:hypothetical protein